MNLTPRNVVLDASALTGFVGANVVMRRRLLSSFMEEAEHKLEELRSASVSGRFHELKMVAHQLRNAARIVGAIALSETARLLEGLDEHDAGEQEVALRLCRELGCQVERFKGAVAAAS